MTTPKPIKPMLTRAEALDKLTQAIYLINEVQSWAHDRFTKGSADEMKDVCHGYSLGLIIGSTSAAKDALVTASGQTMHVKNNVTQ